MTHSEILARARSIDNSMKELYQVRFDMERQLDAYNVQLRWVENEISAIKLVLRAMAYASQDQPSGETSTNPGPVLAAAASCVGHQSSPAATPAVARTDG